VSNHPQSAVSGPEACAGHEGRSKKVDVYPPESASPETALRDERHRLVMGDSGNAGQRSQERQDFVAARESAARQFPQYEVVTFGLTMLESSHQCRVRSMKMVDPDRRVDEH
jgi:hypothetical protein